MLSVLLGLICLAGTSEYARADPSTEDVYRPQILPECKVYKLDDEREVCGWLTIEEVTAAYSADAELVACREVSAAQDGKIKAIGIQFASAMKALLAEQRSVSTLQKRSKQLTDDLIALNKKYEYERAKPRWGAPIAWGSAGILGAALIGIVGYEILD